MNALSQKRALNHMTTPRLNNQNLVDLARDLDCVGIELRNDLAGRTLFDGDAPETVKEAVRRAGLRLLALAEVKRFNAWTDATASEALSLMRTAGAAGAEAISLIPVNDGTGCGNGERQANLRIALRSLKPMLEDHDLIGLVEPLGFDICSLRFKEGVVEAIESLGAVGRFKLIHDTFHHFLAGEQKLFPDHTGLVHISGVTDPKVSAEEMRDRHRVLVDGHDRLGNVQQIAALQSAGYDGPISFECFSSDVQALADPYTEIKRSFDFIASQVQAEAA